MKAAAVPSPPASSYSSAMKIDRFGTEGETLDSVSFPFTRFDAFVLVISIVMFIVDLVTDFWVAYNHIMSGNDLYFFLTAALIVVPSLIVMSFSLRWYEVQCRRPEYEFRPWLAFTLHFLQLAIVYR